MSDPCPYGQKDCPGGAQCVCALPRADLRVRLREAIELVKLHATTEHWTWIREVESELSDDVACEHDLLKPNHTITMTHDLREGMEDASVATCRICRQQWRPAPNSSTTGE